MADYVKATFLTDNPVLRAYFFYVSILILKMLLMTFLTGYQRVARKAFANPEDTAMLKVKVRVDEDVERVRRAHLNDLENIPLFFSIAFIYSLTNPSVAWAILLFRIFTVARILHTLVYAVYVVPQPARALAFTAGALVTGYMAVQSLIYFSSQ